MEIKQGDSYDIHITLTDSDGTCITDEMVTAVEVALGDVIKTYPDGGVGYVSEEPTITGGYWTFPITQEESMSLSGIKRFDVRVKFLNGEVVGAKIDTVNVNASVSTEVL